MFKNNLLIYNNNNFKSNLIIKKLVNYNEKLIISLKKLIINIILLFLIII